MAGAARGAEAGGAARLLHVRRPARGRRGRAAGRGAARAGRRVRAGRARLPGRPARAARLLAARLARLPAAAAAPRPARATLALRGSPHGRTPAAAASALRRQFIAGAAPSAGARRRSHPVLLAVAQASRECRQEDLVRIGGRVRLEDF